MLRKGLAACIGLLLLGVLAFGAIGSGAWFTDSESVPVSAASGRVDISLTGTDSSSMSVTNVMPGVWDNLKTFNVYNSNSTVPVKFRLTPSYTSGDGSLYNALSVRVGTGNCIGNAQGHDNFPGTVYEGPLNALDLNSITSSIFGASGLGLNISACYSFEFSLPANAGNGYQNLSSNFNINVVATQTQNPGWAQS
jgi:hypothetical protein